MDTNNPSTRRRDGDQRRRELCDAAIQVLAEHGSRGLSHGQVDRYADVPEGTTSYYFRTRAALLRGVGKRVAEIDLANLRSIVEHHVDPRVPFAHLAELTLMQADGPGLALNRARHELLLHTARDPELAEASAKVVNRTIALVQEAIAHLQPETTDTELLDAQTDAVATFITGVFTRLAGGDRTFTDPDRLACQLEAIVDAISKTMPGSGKAPGPD
ncbi:TetR/AcrR family transcriptional regulator [Mycolicibacterium diernhoferi]|uniref:TetR family transcriptional regulator n=1 Tax=Mycolicibacterium diernhoferi TaxID=1801 RepID=A0A1Q4HJR5_9MYCO|nr:TetR/AcrR family transcriptional regulator [Mycolicibacterium diernhoferi]OJZ67764.1 TetR family transcriptional regulator [Mycolicibacterium diernhoferi]OPE52370.1 TetR family transcriptional regulator [Mycolicibacterium diernhoferi]PEG51662.1 TetR/AcrR family transcriptional regulator [Mycolicibacterium diernhoferi]QYL20412.1 TetR/AcrR family transcriptional regulator [Mycolicibacterium diernhoferi]